jgi:hypothetical protein
MNHEQGPAPEQQFTSMTDLSEVGFQPGQELSLNIGQGGEPMSVVYFGKMPDGRHSVQLPGGGYRWFSQTELAAAQVQEAQLRPALPDSQDIASAINPPGTVAPAAEVRQQPSIPDIKDING